MQNGVVARLMLYRKPGDAMRTLVVMTSLMMATTASADRGGIERGRTRDDVEERSLNAAQLERYAAAYYPEIKKCYLEHARRSKRSTGELALKLIVHRDGYVHEISIEAPGITGKQLRTLESCIRLEVLAWHFPVRRDFTTAILPYYFLYLDVPGAGPQYSCWNARGCPDKPTKPTKPAKRPRR